ncbi:MAG: carbonic anhydrase [Lentisphaerae bacterium GWF2_52_8]|nr:MAG: carbonic anhydrase [Lentisphaerae bacterium GWF2_52_8]
MKLVVRFVFALCILGIVRVAVLTAAEEEVAKKPEADEALKVLKDGNERFLAGKPLRPHAGTDRIKLAGEANQGAYAYATVLSCSDSRVPVEYVFDAGVMDVFVVRIAGNVCDTDEIGSIEYGIAHVKTPVLVVLGHSQCGAVTAVCDHLQGKKQQLERNIPPLVDKIIPAAERAMKSHSELKGAELLPYAIEENVWQSINDLFMKSPATRQLVKDGKVKLVGAIYDVGSGKVNWLPDAKVAELLKKVEESPEKAKEAYATE